MLIFEIVSCQAFDFKYYGMGIGGNAVLADAEGRVCEYTNIVIRGVSGKCENKSNSLRHGPVSVNFVKRILKCKLTELRTHDFLPHLVRKRKEMALNKNGKRLRLNNTFVRYDPGFHLNTKKKRHSENAISDKSVKAREKETENTKRLLEKLFKTDDVNETIEISRKDLMKFVEENTSACENVHSNDKNLDDKDVENIPMNSNDVKNEFPALAEVANDSDESVDYYGAGHII